MNEDLGDMDLEESASIFKEHVEDRLRQLQSELDANTRINGGLAKAAGLDGSKLPPELRRELDEVTERMTAEPPPLQSE